MSRAVDFGGGDGGGRGRPRLRHAADIGPAGAGGEVFPLLPKGARANPWGAGFDPQRFAEGTSKTVAPHKRVVELIRSAQPKHAAALAAARLPPRTPTHPVPPYPLPSTSRTAFKGMKGNVIYSLDGTSVVRSKSLPLWQGYCDATPKLLKGDPHYENNAGHKNDGNQLKPGKDSCTNRLKNKDCDSHACNLPGCPSIVERVHFKTVAKLMKNGVIVPKGNGKYGNPESFSIGEKKNYNQSYTKRLSAKQDFGWCKTNHSKYVIAEERSDSIFAIKKTIKDEEDEHCHGFKLPFLTPDKKNTDKHREEKRFEAPVNKMSVELPPLLASVPQVIPRANSRARVIPRFEK